MTKIQITCICDRVPGSEVVYRTQVPDTDSELLSSTWHVSIEKGDSST
jgi:hypothetical protein